MVWNGIAAVMARFVVLGVAIGSLGGAQTIAAQDPNDITLSLGATTAQPGDTVEVHWVHSSCDVAPGEGLGSCLNDSCKNPQLRVETQVFLVVNDPKALDFMAFDHNGAMIRGVHQAKALPTGTGDPATYLGSTTGPSYSQEICSPFQVTWSVRPECAKVNIATLHKWCEGNTSRENHAHGVRHLVTAPALLAPMD